MLSVLVADDHPVVRKGVRNILREAAGITEVYEAATADETLDRIARYQPDVVVMNTTLADANTLSVLLELRHQFPELPVVLFHPEADPDFARRALAYGANGIVTKLADAEELVKAVQTVAASETYLCSVLAAMMNDAVSNGCKST